MIFTELHRQFLPLESLEETPSRKDGVSAETERQQRLWACCFIQEGGVRLGLPQQAICTAQVLLGRFYLKQSLAKFDVRWAAMACTFLATKLEETLISDPSKGVKRQVYTRDIIRVFRRLVEVQQGRETTILDVMSARYDREKEQLVRMERFVLRYLGFMCHVEHPHKYALLYLRELGAPELARAAWAACNDAALTDLPAAVSAEVIACGAVFLAAREARVALPESPPWWEAFGTTSADVALACRFILGVREALGQPRAYEPLTAEAREELEREKAEREQAKKEREERERGEGAAGAEERATSGGVAGPPEGRTTGGRVAGSRWSQGVKASEGPVAAAESESRGAVAGGEGSVRERSGEREADGHGGRRGGQESAREAGRPREGGGGRDRGRDGDERDRVRDWSRDRDRGRDRDRDRDRERERDRDRYRDRDRHRGRDRDRERDRDGRASRHRDRDRDRREDRGDRGRDRDRRSRYGDDGSDGERGRRRDGRDRSASGDGRRRSRERERGRSPGAQAKGGREDGRGRRSRTPLEGSLPPPPPPPPPPGAHGAGGANGWGESGRASSRSRSPSGSRGEWRGTDGAGSGQERKRGRGHEGIADGGEGSEGDEGPSKRARGDEEADGTPGRGTTEEERAARRELIKQKMRELRTG